MKKKILIVLISIVIIVSFLVVVNGIFEFIQRAGTTMDKPVIYFYSEEELDVTVELEVQGDLTCTYPKYNNGWDIVVHPNQTLTNNADGLLYRYLYWEASSTYEYNLDKGFVVKGEDSAEFLRDKLSFLGLTLEEYNEFIIYWLPKMECNEYNLIHFSTTEYEENAKLSISPEPDTLLRVFMVFKGLDEPIDIEEQVLEASVREGFTVVEWGGSEVN